VTVVDVHCHTFNADDIPVKGFFQHVELHDARLGSALASVLDSLTQGAAPGYATDLARVDAILGPSSALESAAAFQPQSQEQFESEVDAAVRDLQARSPATVDRIGTLMAEAEADDPGAAVGEEGIGDTVAAARRGIRWVKMFARSRLDQTADLVRTFDDEVDLFIPLLVDLGTGLGDQAKTSNREQMVLYEKISRLSMMGQLPGQGKAHFHFFIGFDPLRELRARQVGDIETPLDLVKTAVGTYGFVGVKVYPPMGWRPSSNEAWGPINTTEAAMLDRIVIDLAAWCADDDVPITAHGNASNYADPHYEQGGYGSPAQWRAVLERCPSLHLNLGHFGGARLNETPEGWPWQIAKAMHDFPGLYADVGNHRIDNEALVEAYFAMLLAMREDTSTAVVTERLMFGTDWFMEAIHPQPGRFLQSYRAAYDQHLGDAAATARFMGENALCFLGFDDPDNQNGARLRARYDRFAPGAAPAWLADREGDR
jgi:predicted TIM-barrel fold metal-dependent hydrolase